MHRQLFNQVKIIIHISPITPLLIKSGMESADPSLPDMNFVRTYNPQYGETVYIPGSSFKGVLRSYSEKILRTLEKPCCNPSSNSSCSKDKRSSEKTEKGTGAQLYKDSCFACKMYGSTNIASRVQCTDGYPKEGKYKTEKRTGVAIDRVLGSAMGGALFDLEVVTNGVFICEIFLHNFQLWQLGLIGLTLRDLDDGYLQLGFAKSRGLGRVSAKVKEIEMSYIGKPGFNGKLWGVGMNETLRKEYGFLEDDYVATDKTPVFVGFRTIFKWHDDNSLFEAIVNQDSPCWQAFLNFGENHEPR